ncbi:MAG: GNAT family N-acetyltransferase [Meiothermus sp.]|nr:GNAT family N-acetyltransferase [Meiothermus sp.]
MEWQKDEYTVSTDLARFDLELIHYHLSEVAYWSQGIPLEVVQKSFANSLSFGIFRGEEMIGWARLITDRATFAYLADVYVLEAHRGGGLSKWLMECIQAHPELQGLRRWMLATRDAHGLYTQYGFRPIAAPERWMERHFPDVYKQS